MTKIAFVSCANVEKRKLQPAWDHIAASAPDLLLLLGDNTYMNWVETKWEPDRLLANYEAQFQIKAFKDLIHSVPTLAIWDDHDLGPNDSCGGAMADEQVKLSRSYFDKYLAVAINNNRPHMYCTHDIGDVRVIMLDVRTYRTLSSAPAATVLGAAQEQWLWDQLALNPKPYTIVASGSVSNRGASGHKLTDYKQFWQRLRNELSHVPPKPDPKSNRKVLFLSGDIHDNRWKKWNGYFFEATSSGVACVVGDPALPTDNWGLLEYGNTELRVTLNGHAPSYSGVHRLRLSDWTEIL